MIVAGVLVGQDVEVQEVRWWVAELSAEIHLCCEYLADHAVLIGLDVQLFYENLVYEKW